MGRSDGCVEGQDLDLVCWASYRPSGCPLERMPCSSRGRTISPPESGRPNGVKRAQCSFRRKANVLRVRLCPTDSDNGLIRARLVRDIRLDGCHETEYPKKQPTEPHREFQRYLELIRVGGKRSPSVMALIHDGTLHRCWVPYTACQPFQVLSLAFGWDFWLGGGTIGLRDSGWGRGPEPCRPGSAGWGAGATERTGCPRSVHRRPAAGSTSCLLARPRQRRTRLVAARAHPPVACCEPAIETSTARVTGRVSAALCRAYR